jgi:uncharacterized YigZ family protein
MLILTGTFTAETKVKNSRFAAEAVYVSTPEEARELWKLRKQTCDNGGHIVYAFAVGPQQNICGCSDDGEPSGTAGKPVLAVLKGSGITNILITIARYFGGTKLGVSGLIQAYREAAADVLDQADIIELTVDTVVRVDFSYMVMNDVMRIIKDESPKVVEQSFDNLCTITLAIRKSKAEQLLGKLSKVSGATLEVLENEL